MFFFIVTRKTQGKTNRTKHKCNQWPYCYALYLDPCQAVRHVWVDDDYEI